MVLPQLTTKIAWAQRGRGRSGYVLTAIAQEPARQLMPGHSALGRSRPVCRSSLLRIPNLHPTPAPRYIELLGSVANHQAALFSLVMGR